MGPSLLQFPTPHMAEILGRILLASLLSFLPGLFLYGRVLHPRITIWRVRHDVDRVRAAAFAFRRAHGRFPRADEMIPVWNARVTYRPHKDDFAVCVGMTWSTESCWDPKAAEWEIHSID